jgi:hypothetical protein
MRHDVARQRLQFRDVARRIVHETSRIVHETHDARRVGSGTTVGLAVVNAAFSFACASTRSVLSVIE